MPRIRSPAAQELTGRQRQQTWSSFLCVSLPDTSQTSPVHVCILGTSSSLTKNCFNFLSKGGREGKGREGREVGREGGREGKGRERAGWGGARETERGGQCQGNAFQTLALKVRCVCPSSDRPDRLQAAVTASILEVHSGSAVSGCLSHMLHFRCYGREGLAERG